MAEFDLTAELGKVLGEYTTAVQVAVDNAVEECGKGMQKEIKANSPKRTGAYTKGWRCEISENGRGSKQAIIKNKTNYQLTHLLEKGHKKRGGKGRVKAYVHIAPAAEKWTGKFEQMCKEACKGK